MSRVFKLTENHDNTVPSILKTNPDLPVSFGLIALTGATGDSYINLDTYTTVPVTGSRLLLRNLSGEHGIMLADTVTTLVTTGTHYFNVGVTGSNVLPFSVQPKCGVKILNPLTVNPLSVNSGNGYSIFAVVDATGADAYECKVRSIGTDISTGSLVYWETLTGSYSSTQTGSVTNVSALTSTPLSSVPYQLVKFSTALNLAPGSVFYTKEINRNSNGVNSLILSR